MLDGDVTHAANRTVSGGLVATTGFRTLADTRSVVRVPAQKGRATTATRGRSASRCWASLLG